MARVILAQVSSLRPDRFLHAGKFGTRTAQWTVHSGQSAADIAAAWMQHRMAVRANDLISASAVTLSSLAEAVGEQPENLRRKLTGASQARLGDVLSWLLAMGRHDEDGLSGDAMSLLPPSHQAAARGWVPGRFDLPVFVPPAEGDPATWDWRSVAEDVHQLCRTEMLAGRGRLMEEGLLRHALLMSLERLGVEPHRMFTKQRLPTAGAEEVDVDIVIGPGLAAGLALVLLPQSVAADAATQARILSASASRVLALGATALQTRVVILVGSQQLLGSINELFRWTPSDDGLRRGRLGLEAVVRLGEGDAGPSPSYTAVEVSEFAQSQFVTGSELGVLACSVGKTAGLGSPGPGQPPT